jgi:hypothetical protein
MGKRSWKRRRRRGEATERRKGKGTRRLAGRQLRRVAYFLSDKFRGALGENSSKTGGDWIR